MSKKPFSDSRWRGGIEDVKGMQKIDSEREFHISKEEIWSMVKEADEYRRKHGMPPYDNKENE